MVSLLIEQKRRRTDPDQSTAFIVGLCCRPEALSKRLAIVSEERVVSNSTDINGAASGLAALSIVESLLLAMGDLKVMNESEVLGVMTDAAATHRNAGGSAKDMALHLEVVAILDRIVAGGNSIRRP
jgi:hypothetical protein